MSQSHGRLVGSAFLITASTYFSYALGLLVGAIVARGLGPELYGRYAYLVWLSGWLVVFATNGLTTAAIRFVSELRGRGDEAGAKDAHGYLNRLQWAAAGIAVVGFVGASFAFPDASWSVGGSGFVIAAAICVVSRTMYLFDISVAKGYGAYHIEAYSTTAVAIANAAAAAVLWWLNAGLEEFVAVYVGSSALMLLAGRAQLRSERIRATYGVLVSSDKQEVRKHLAWSGLLVGVGVFGNRAIETFILNAHSDSTHLGYFTLAGSLARSSTELLTVGLQTVLMPAMGHAFGAGGRDRAHEIFRKAMRYFMFLGILLAGASSFVAAPAVALLYGPKYEPVVLSLQVMQITGGLTLSAAAIAALLTTTGQQSIWAKVNFIPVGISLVAAPLLVPEFGINGALVSSTVARVVGFLALAVVAIRSQSIEMPWRSFAGLLASGLLAVLLGSATQLILPGTLGQILAAMVFIAALIAFSAPLGAWQATDARLVHGLMSRFPRSALLLRPIERYLQKLP